MQALSAGLIVGGQAAGDVSGNYSLGFPRRHHL